MVGLYVDAVDIAGAGHSFETIGEHAIHRIAHGRLTRKTVDHADVIDMPASTGNTAVISHPPTQSCGL